MLTCARARCTKPRQILRARAFLEHVPLQARRAINASSAITDRSVKRQRRAPLPSVRSVKRITILEANTTLSGLSQRARPGDWRSSNFQAAPCLLRLDRWARPTHVRCRDRMYLFCLLPAQLARASRAAHPVQDHSHETLARCRRVALADVSVLHGGSPEVGPCGSSFGSRKSKSRAHWLGPAPRMTRRSACSNQIPATPLL